MFLATQTGPIGGLVNTFMTAFLARKALYDDEQQKRLDMQTPKKSRAQMRAGISTASTAPGRVGTSKAAIISNMILCCCAGMSSYLCVMFSFLLCVFLGNANIPYIGDLNVEAQAEMVQWLS